MGVPLLRAFRFRGTMRIIHRVKIMRPIGRILYSHLPTCRNHTMPKSKNPDVSSRKQPQQARSNELVSAVLQAATQVLAREGATRFTTARVAEKAGISIGSLYQYFPNKAAILFRLQSDEWQQTLDMLRRILDDTATPPLTRLRTLVHAFIRSECEEAEVRGALNDAAPFYRDSPEAKAIRAESDRMFGAFMEQLLPDAAPASRELASDMISTTLGTVGSSFSRTRRTKAEMVAYSDALADMFCAYVRSIQQD